uniref:Uncharacterized protein n=1 Tax=Eutreptiella gymnastica TaxID=73025 RepID=A0A7S1I7Y1_9EUGL
MYYNEYTAIQESNPSRTGVSRLACVTTLLVATATFVLTGTRQQTSLYAAPAVKSVTQVHAVVPVTARAVQEPRFTDAPEAPETSAFVDYTTTLNPVGAPTPQNRIAWIGTVTSILLVAVASMAAAVGYRRQSIAMACGCSSCTCGKDGKGGKDSKDSNKDDLPSPKPMRARFPFEEARIQAHNYGFQSREEYLEYKCAGAYGPPRKPEEVYAGQFVDWEDWLGVPFTLTEATAILRAFSVRSEAEYAAFMADEASATLRYMDGNPNRCDVRRRLPHDPPKKFRSEWPGWEQWLGAEAGLELVEG